MKLWIARTKRGLVHLFRFKPRYMAEFDIWTDESFNDDMMHIYNFPEVTFENSPQEVELVIKK